MIDLETDFPFEFCRVCQKIETQTENMALFSFFEIVENRILVSCKNANICKYLVEKIKKGELKK